MRAIFDVQCIRSRRREKKGEIPATADRPLRGNRNRRIKTQELLLSLVQATRYCSCSLNLRSCARISVRSSNHHILVTFASPSPRHTLGTAHRCRLETPTQRIPITPAPGARQLGLVSRTALKRKRICAARDLFKPLAPRNPAALPPPAWHQGLQIGRTCRQRGGRRRR